MKSKVIILGAAVAMVGASVAFAAPPAGKGKPATTGTGCKPSISVILKGKLAGDGAAVPFSLPLTVTGGNKFARAYKSTTQPVSIQVSSTTKINRRGQTSSTDLKTGDVVNVRARVCKADLANNATPALSATRVVAHPPTA
jgi:hypothetical protein